MFRFGWERMEAKLIDKKFVKRRAANRNQTVHYQWWDFMVELPAEAGNKPVRLVIRERTFKLRNMDLGDTVPVLVNRRRTKAAFDLKDPQISTLAAEKLAKAAREAQQVADEERFQQKLSE